MDFLNVFLLTGTLNSRIIVSLGHFKRMVKAMSENLAKYEATHRRIEEPEAPQGGMGFQA